MRRQPKARTTKSKSRIDDFFEIKSKAHQRRKDQTIELEINMERLGSKVVEMHNVSKSFKDKVILDGFDYNFKKGERIGTNVFVRHHLVFQQNRIVFSYQIKSVLIIVVR